MKKCGYPARYYKYKFNNERLAMNVQYDNKSDILLELALNKRYASIWEGYRITNYIIAGGYNYGPNGNDVADESESTCQLNIK
jgi:hypothetical protein